MPTGNDQIVDKAFPTHGPVYQELAKFLPGLAGESRSFDANGQFFKVLGTGGAETLNLGNGVFGSTFEPVVGVNPPPVRDRPPLRPDVPCETQEPPDLRSIPTGPADGRQHGERGERASAGRGRSRSRSTTCAACSRLQGRDTKVLDRSITLSEIRSIAADNGLTRQLDKALARAGR